MSTPLPRTTRALLALIVAGLFALVVPVAANAATVHVEASGGADVPACGSEALPCGSIDYAANTIATPGSTLLVGPGGYAGATIAKALRLVGPKAGIAGPERDLNGAGIAVIRDTLDLQAGAIVDGFDFASPLADEPTVRIGVAGAAVAGAVLRNNVFRRTSISPVVLSDLPSERLVVEDNLFVNQPGGEGVGIFLHAEGTAPHATGARIEGNEFRDFDNATPGLEGTAIDAGGVPGLQVLGNRVVNGSGLLSISSTDGADGRVVVRGNTGDGFSGDAITVGVGAIGVDIERNRLRNGVGAAVLFVDGAGVGTTSDVRVLGNDVEGFASALRAAHRSNAGMVVARGNRFVDTARGGYDVYNLSSDTSLDARGNWWGANDPAVRIHGVSDVRGALRLDALLAPATLRPGGSGEVRAQLAGVEGGEPEANAGWFAAAFTTTNGSLDRTSVDFELGAASVLLTVPARDGSTTTTATLDAETVSATTRIDATASPSNEDDVTISEPGSAAGPAARPRLVSSVEVIGSRARTLTEGIRMSMFLHRIVVVRETVTISHRTAVNLGLRPADSALRTRLVVGTSYTRVKPGRRTIIVRLRPTYRRAVAQIDRMVGVQVQTVVTAPHMRRVVTRRVELPRSVH